MSYNIICNGEEYPINSNTILWTEPEGLKCKYYNKHLYGGKREVSLFINHWDICRSSADCVGVLEQRRLSVHFSIDNDGTIYQLMDANDVASHALGANYKSIGVEISNAYFLKHQKWYMEKGFGERPVLSGIRVHDELLPDFLGFYPCQIDALKELWKAVRKAYPNIPLSCPVDKDGNTLMGTSTPIADLVGIISHYHLNRQKIDCAGLDIAELIKTL